MERFVVCVIIVVIAWLASLYAWWGYTWAGWAEAGWSRIKDDPWRARGAALLRMSWTREEHVRRGKLTTLIAVIATTIVMGIVVWQGGCAH